jgi:hypothetical protein
MCRFSSPATQSIQLLKGLKQSVCNNEWNHYFVASKNEGYPLTHDVLRKESATSN